MTDGAAIRTTHDAVLRLSLHFALELKRIFLPLLLDILLPSPRSTGNLILFLPLIIFVILRTIVLYNYTGNYLREYLYNFPKTKLKNKKSGERK